MDQDVEMENADVKNVKCFMNALTNSSWMVSANENTINELLEDAKAIQNRFRLGEIENVREIENLFPGIEFKKSLELLLENLIKNPNLNENLTLHAIKQCQELDEEDNLCKMLENTFVEIKVRENLSQLFEKLAERNVVDVHWHKINSLLSELDTSSGKMCAYKILNDLKAQTSCLLNAVMHCNDHKAKGILSEIINCLELPSDLKLWFILMKEENLELVLKLCSKHNNFLEAVLNFFNKFANEIETNYDEDLNSHYSHLNLDFDEFIKLFKQFLSNKNLSKVIYEYLESKILTEDKNFLFWIDVKACI